MERRYNLDQLVSVDIVDKKEVRNFKYVPSRKRIFSSEKDPEGFKDSYSGSIFSKEDLINGRYLDVKFFVEDNKVYYFPYITLCFVNGDKVTQQYSTIGEAKAQGMYLSQFKSIAVIKDGKLTTHN